MSWKNVPAWLKGGIIADVLFLFLLLILGVWIRFLREGIENIFEINFYSGTADVVLGYATLATNFLYGLPFLIMFVFGAIIGEVFGRIFKREESVIFIV